MPGERLARATFTGLDEATDGTRIQIEYVGTRYDLVARDTPTGLNEFQARNGRDFSVKLRQLMQRLALPYIVDAIVYTGGIGLTIVREVTLTAPVYDLQYNIGVVGVSTNTQLNISTPGAQQFPVLTVASTIMPVNVVVRATQATVFGATDGAIALTTSG